ncbi:MAG TPA: hypothetical protein VIK20_00545 [Bacteroidales bacterium]
MADFPGDSSNKKNTASLVTRNALSETITKEAAYQNILLLLYKPLIDNTLRSKY